MKTNILSLAFRKVDCPASASVLVGELRVDGEPVGDKYSLDVRALAQSLLNEGEHFIFTCGCGVPDCAGIHDGFKSRIAGDSLILVGSLPKGGAMSFAFSAAQARKALADALAGAKPLVDELSQQEEGEETVMGFGRGAYNYSRCIEDLRAS
jgi:hypothetical protein